MQLLYPQVSSVPWALVWNVCIISCSSWLFIVIGSCAAVTPASLHGDYLVFVKWFESAVWRKWSTHYHTPVSPVSSLGNLWIAQITRGGGRRGQLWSQARTAIDTKAQQTLGMTGMNVKRKKYSSTFKTEWTSTFDTLGPSSASKFQAYCKLCWMDFSIEHSGKADCQRHVGTEKHKNVES